MWRLAVVCLGVLPMLAVSTPALARPVQVLGSEQLADGVRYERIQVRLADGAIARGNLVRWRESQAGVALRPLLANGTIAGLETTPSMAARALRQGAVAGVNGGYLLPRPTGNPNGPYAEDGWLRSGPAVGSNGSRLTEGRGTIGITAGGQVLMDRVQPDLQLTLPDGRVLVIDDVNRTPRCPASGSLSCPAAGEVIVYDDGFGTGVPVPAGSVVLDLEARRIPAAGQLSTRVLRVRQSPDATRLTVPDGRLLLVAYGPTNVAAVTALTNGTALSLDVAVRPRANPAASWDDLVHAVPGAPLLLRDGRRQPALFSSAMTRDDNEALGEAHRLGRNPRTALGRTAAGELLMITIDGRRAGWSVGVTLLELTQILEGLGATDAVNLDGGGTTTMTLHGTIVNRPSEANRRAVNGLFLHVPQRTWFLRNWLSGGAAEQTTTFAFASDQVLACDWNGNGIDTPGTFTNGRWVLSNRVDGGGALRTFSYGIQPGDIAVCGDWNGDGRDTIGVVRGNQFLLRNANSAGRPDLIFRYGRASDTPLVGDWNGNGRDGIGVRRGDRFLLRNQLSGGPANLDFRYGRAGDIPVIGDWNANGRDGVGVRRGNRYFLRNRLSGGPADRDFHFGRADDTPIVGDWNGNGRDGLGVVR